MIQMNTPSIFFRFIAFFSLLAALQLHAQPAQYHVTLERVDDMSRHNIAAWWSPIIYDAESQKVFVSYLRPGPEEKKDDVYVAMRESDGTWVTENTGGKAWFDDGHTQTSLAMDGNGVLHVPYGMHWHIFKNAVSKGSRTVVEGFELGEPSAFRHKGRSFTYPNLATARNGDVYLIIRQKSEGVLYQYDASKQEWRQVTAFAGEEGATVYPDEIFAGGDGDLHIIWEWAAGGPQGARHQGSYARFEPETETFYRADGTEYASLPISRSEADIFQPMEGGEQFARGVPGFQSAKMALDDQGRPLIAYAYSPNQKHNGYEHRLARWDGARWVRQTVTEGPFAKEKPWISFHNGVIRYYGALAPSEVKDGGKGDLYARASRDFGLHWSAPMRITENMPIPRPIGTSHEGLDLLYLPSNKTGELFFAYVRFRD